MEKRGIRKRDIIMTKIGKGEKSDYKKGNEKIKRVLFDFYENFE